MIILIILAVLLVAAMTFMAGIVAILSTAWPFLLAFGVVGFIVWLLDRLGILPNKDERQRKRSKKGKKRNKRK